MFYTEKQLFCARYLRDTGALVNGCVDPEMLSMLDDKTFDYTMTRVNTEDFYTQLAMGLRTIWPAGEKDGKYPWRDSVKNIASRLKVMWQLRNLGEYSIDECLTVARRYVAQFENQNAKYMKTLKYFILRQNMSTVGKDGRITYSSASTFADMLENQNTEADWGDILSGDDMNEIFEVR